MIVLDGVHLTAGYRETWDYTRTDTTGKASYRVPFNGQLIAVPVYGESPAAGATVVSTVVNLPSNGSYDLSADWQLNNDTLLYLAHRSGYKTGGINASANPGAPGRTYGPEHAKDIELGAKTEWTLGGVRGQVNIDIYHTWFSDIQEGEIIPGTAQGITTNLANAGIDGLELEGTIVPAEWFRLTGNVAFTDATYSGWLEDSTCAAQYWRPQCQGLSGNTAIAIDHSRGRLEVAGQTTAFRPDRFSNTSRWQWSVQPSLLLRSWLGEDVAIAATLYHRGPYVDAVAVANTSKTAGLAPVPRETVFGYSTTDPYDAPGYTLADVRVDWRHAMGTHLSVAAAVTNAANKIYRVSSASSFEAIGDVYTIVGEPRMWFAEVSYEF